MASWIKGATATDGDALNAAAALLADARMPAISGLVADVDAIRAGLRLASEIGAFLDPLARPQIYAEWGPFAGSGTMETVPGEAIARADLVLALGAAAARSGLLRDLAARVPMTGTQAGAARRIICLGASPPPGIEAEVHEVEPERLAAAIGLLRAVAAARLAGEAPYPELAAGLRAAHFAILLYDPGELGDLAVEMTTALAKDVSESTRCFGLPLAGPWQGRSLVQVAGWTLACGPAAGFGRARPEHDPWRFDLARAAAAGEADAALWLAPLPAPRPRWTDTVPTVSLLSDASGDESEIVIEVAQPGRDAAGSLWHERRNAIVHCPASAPGRRPGAADILATLGRAVLRRRAAQC